MLTEHTYISEFNVQPSGNISVRKTTEIRRNGQVIGLDYWRVVLMPNDPQVEEVLSEEPYYLNLAQQAWATLPEVEATPIIPPAAGN